MVVSVASLAVLVPVGRRVGGGEQPSVGATRSLGQKGVMFGTIGGLAERLRGPDGEHVSERRPAPAPPGGEAPARD